MTTRALAVVSAGLGQPSSTSLLASRLTIATTDQFARRGVDVHVITTELREYAHDLTDNLLTGFASEALQDAKDAVAGADGLIAVTPIFSASYNGLFKTFFDVLDDGALRGKPVLAATAGTARHSLALEHALRPLFAYLGALTSPTAVFAAAEDWGQDSRIEAGLAARVRRAGVELADLITAREPTSAADPLAIPSTFEQLLAAN